MDGVAAGLRAAAAKGGGEHDSISPVATKDHQTHRAVGAHFGIWTRRSPAAKWSAKNATLSIMAGGHEGRVRRVRPLFERWGENIPPWWAEAATARPPGVWIIVALNIGPLAEGAVIRLARRRRPARVRGRCWALRLVKILGACERMIRRTFRPGFRIARCTRRT